MKMVLRDTQISRSREGEEERRTLPAIAAIATVSTVAATAAAAPATIAAASTATTTAVITTPAASTLAFGLRTSFIHHKVPAAEVLAVETGNSAVRVFITGNFDKGETTRLPSETVTNQTDCRSADP
ncbi:MAG TPA: hypothetical protein VMU53_12555 [Candidatus Sulfotelmatobacter sp.]|nr:hypothetical protein [Candidatus Sulfotelmatobacter sp.]